MADDGIFKVAGAGQLGTEERKDVWIDCTPQLTDVSGTVIDSVQSVEWTADKSSITIDAAPLYDDARLHVGAWVSNPKADTCYRLKARCTSNGGRIFEEIYVIGGIEK